MKRSLVPAFLALALLTGLFAGGEGLPSIEAPSFMADEYQQLDVRLAELGVLLRNPPLVAAMREDAENWPAADAASFVGHVLSSAGYAVVLALKSTADPDDAWVLVQVALGQRAVWIPVVPSRLENASDLLGVVAVVADPSSGGWICDPPYYSYDTTAGLPPNLPPVIVFARRLSQAKAEATTWFSARDSHDPDGTIVLYSWDFGDGNGAFSDKPIVGHEFDGPGAYQVTLTVYDNGGAWARSTFTLRVDAGCGCG